MLLFRTHFEPVTTKLNPEKPCHDDVIKRLALSRGCGKDVDED
jgi:hypothetical protein